MVVCKFCSRDQLKILALKYRNFSNIRTFKCSTADQMIKSNSRLNKYFAWYITENKNEYLGRSRTIGSRRINFVGAQITDTIPVRPDSITDFTLSTVIYLNITRF